ncbi:hypothetical protein BJY01DRAFT_260609 [Aspergillus pseudoustus]|uniref:DUF1917-domain-containing protein n=1 Tax=Aspergillus pseudoustus TaxID=1810923 RepID=A0ABR4ITZ5_9EURO
MTDLKAEDILSDDSSFYGDGEETKRLERKATEYDEEQLDYWTTIHPHLLSTIQENYRSEQKLLATKKMSPTPMDIDKPACMPFNRLGPDESSSAFLARLPASTTREENAGPWIYLHTPYTFEKQEDLSTLQREGLKALYAYETEEARLRQENDQKGGSNAALSRKLSPLRRELETCLFALAQATNVVTGKWMLFITPDRIDSYWRAVVEGTMRGELGHAAKVATDAGDGEGRARLICIYTKDYRDREDIKQVLMRLMELKLVRKGERPIYYKCDVLTHLEIMSGNRYGLKPTLLSSADVINGKI